MVPRKLFPLLVILFLAGHYAPGSLPAAPAALVLFAAGLMAGAFLGALRSARVMLCVSSALMGSATVLPAGGFGADGSGAADEPPKGGIWECRVTTTTVRGAMLECDGENFWASSRDMAQQLRRPDSVTVLGSVDGPWMNACAFRPRPSPLPHDRLRRFLCAEWQRRIPSREASSLTAALIAGERATVTRRTSDLFRTTGTSHILAVSGTQVTLVAAALFLALRRLAGATWVTTTASSVLISFYVMLTGAAPSILRAGVMFLILLAVSRRTGRKPDVLLAWAVAAVVVMLATSMRALSDAGAQMSFAAVLSLVLIGRRFRGPMGGAISVIVAGVVVTVCLAPLVGSVYGYVSRAAPLATLGSMPYMIAVMLLGPLVLTWGPVPSMAAALLEWTVFLWLEALKLMDMPSVVIGPAWLPAWAGGVFLLWVLCRRGRYPARFGLPVRGSRRRSRPSLHAGRERPAGNRP
jgi:ComEC/Rec2-related protein